MKDKASDGRPPQIHIETAVIEEYDLNAQAGWLYVVLVAHVNGKTGVAFPGLARLAKLTGMTKPTVIKYIKVLEDKGLIEVIREKVEGTNESAVNHYRILPATKGSKTTLPPSQDEVVKPFDYVKNDVDHLVNEVDNGSKTAEPQVVKQFDSNHIESNKTELTKEQSASAPASPEVEKILSLIKSKKKQPTAKVVQAAIFAYSFDAVYAAVFKAANKSNVTNVWSYAQTAFEDEQARLTANTSPSSSGAVSPSTNDNGFDLRKVQREQMERNARLAREKKASGQS